ncbi:uncharacterized protein [Halyomorpha halys]|nr:uncharacterized protein LOC106688543 isoform X1 [Halyomorpha halys]
MANNEMQIYLSQGRENGNAFKRNMNSILPSGLKNILANKNELTHNVDNLFTVEEQQRFLKIMGGINFINEDLSNILDNPLDKEDQKRIEELMNDNLGRRDDSFPAKSSLELNLDSRKMERIKAIDRLLEEMKAKGHAYNKNITSSKCKSRYTKTMKTLDELKAEMNKIEESLENNRIKRKIKSLTQEFNTEK